MKIGFVQTSPVLGKVEQNLARAEELIGDLEADLIVLPELFTTGYDLESRSAVEALAEPADGATARRLSELACRRSTYIAYGFAERVGDAVYNAALLVGPDGPVGGYRKTHLFMREKTLFDPGESSPPVFSIARLGVNLGLMICFDWVFPEVARTLALGGAQILVHPSNLVMPWCQAAMLTRSIENRVFAVTANRVGSEGELEFTGQSQVTSPRGELLVRAPERGELAAAVEIDPGQALDKRINPLNDLFADRRPELYRLG